VISDSYWNRRFGHSDPLSAAQSLSRASPSPSLESPRRDFTAWNPASPPISGFRCKIARN
jgi:hypothetical protein